jgi:hypothetical protein
MQTSRPTARRCVVERDALLGKATVTSRLNEMEYEGLIVIGRLVATSYQRPDEVQALADVVDQWAERLSLPLGLVYCSTTMNWPDGVEFAGILIGLVTFSGYGASDAPIAHDVSPDAMDISRAESIPSELWEVLERDHEVTFEGTVDVRLAVAGWAWARLERDGAVLCGAAAEDDGYVRIPDEVRSAECVLRVGYC